MPAGKHKSRSFRRVQRRTPGARTVTHYRKRNPSAAKCTACGDVLKGTPRLRQYKMRNAPKTSKRPERPFGGVLCSKCSRAKIKSAVSQA